MEGHRELFERGMAARANHDFRNAYKLLAEAMEQGSGEAAWELGRHEQGAKLGNAACQIWIHCDTSNLPIPEDLAAKDPIAAAGIGQHFGRSNTGLLEMAERGDAWAQVEASQLTNHKCWMEKAFQLGHQNAFYILATLYIFLKKYQEALQCATLANMMHHHKARSLCISLTCNQLPNGRHLALLVWRFDYLEFHSRLLCTRQNSSFSTTELLREAFTYGQLDQVDPTFITDYMVKIYSDIHQKMGRPRLIYTQASGRARAAALCFVWARLTHKDVARKIGQMVWDTRIDPEVWGVEWYE